MLESTGLFHTPHGQPSTPALCGDSRVAVRRLLLLQVRSYVVGHVESASPRLQGRLRTLLEKNASVRRNVDSYKASLQVILTRENQDRLLTQHTEEEVYGREKQPVWLGWLAKQEEKMEAEWGVALAQLSS
ncbi:hypothetical protein E2320_023059 [Naja naja]|nr:hypothetical protein E2320_023059 [Naja naja]